MRAQIRQSTLQQFRRVLEHAKRYIARMAQQATNSAGPVAVVNGELNQAPANDLALRLPTDSACMALLLQQRVIFVLRNTELLFQLPPASRCRSVGTDFPALAVLRPVLWRHATALCSVVFDQAELAPGLSSTELCKGFCLPASCTSLGFHVASYLFGMRNYSIRDSRPQRDSNKQVG